jgi:HEPN domain-containing protein
MNRTDFQQLAEERVRDAEALISHGQWSGAYYLAGYAVECGLKACISKLTGEHDFPDKVIAQKSYTHDIESLVTLAELKVERDTDAAADPVFSGNWSVLKDWDENARYRLMTEVQARELFNAVTDSKTGVLPWIKVRW